MRAYVKSYAVNIDIFSPRCFISMSRRIVTLRVLSEVLVDLSEMVFQAAKLQKNAEAPQWASAFYPFEDDGFRS